MEKHVYVSRPADEWGLVHYPAEEHLIWEKLYARQRQLVEGRACDEFIKGLDLLKFSPHYIPQHMDINARLATFYGWQVDQVAAIIPAGEFYQLLSERKFPAASFIRTIEELDYIQEPDIFHELFGHCPLLTHKPYADFMEWFGKNAIQRAKGKERWQLFRLFWFTIEFGLIQTPKGVRAYGGGILSSINETVYSVESPIPERVPFDLLTVLRTPFRIDILQPLYFVIQDFDQLFSIMEQDVFKILAQARELGDLPPKFPPRADAYKGYVT